MSFSTKNAIFSMINLRRYPSKLKMSTIVPVFKCDDKTEPDPKYLDCQTSTVYLKALRIGDMCGDRTGNQLNMPC